MYLRKGESNVCTLCKGEIVHYVKAKLSFYKTVLVFTIIVLLCPVSRCKARSRKTLSRQPRMQLTRAKKKQSRKTVVHK